MILNPLDGRYKNAVSELALLIGEDALILLRIKTECLYLLALSDAGIINLNRAQRSKILSFGRGLPGAAETVKQIETEGRSGIKATRHDVKAVEYYLRELFAENGLKNYTQWLHFALTSEDVNSLCYALMIRDSLEKVLIPSLENLSAELRRMSREYAGDILLARTHGQPAVPTTFGKEFKVFEYRLSRQLKQLKKQQISCKFGGAVGNYNSHTAAFDGIDWRAFSKKFVESFNAERKSKIFLWEVSTQIDPHDTYAELFDNLRRVNMILIDFAQDIWRYISDGLIKQNAVKGEVGSSTMPQKVNPIDFEQAEGNLGLANALFNFFSGKLTVSRLQRDLSDSTALRNIGSAFGYSLTAYKSLQKGLGRIKPDASSALAELRRHPEVVSEGVQTLLRVFGREDAYEELKNFTRGKSVSAEDMENFIKSLNLTEQQKNKLLALKAEKYIGLAEKIARKVYL
ncbi:MAG: adenylosuccinate lyase [Elusimicrobiaceae bacterium]